MACPAYLKKVYGTWSGNGVSTPNESVGSKPVIWDPRFEETGSPSSKPSWSKVVRIQNIVVGTLSTVGQTVPWHWTVLWGSNHRGLSQQEAGLKPQIYGDFSIKIRVGWNPKTNPELRVNPNRNWEFKKLNWEVQPTQMGLIDNESKQIWTEIRFDQQTSRLTQHTTAVLICPNSDWLKIQLTSFNITWDDEYIVLSVPLKVAGMNVGEVLDPINGL